MSNFNIAPLLLSPQFKIVRQNILYVVALILFLFLGLSFVPSQLLEYNNLKQREQELQEEIKKQETRLQIIESITINDLNQLLIVLNTLYPQKEDQFSIYPVINNLQSITGMLFIKKSSPFGGENQTQETISINAIATQDQIRTLLRDYPYKAARILTIDHLVINPVKNNLQLWEVAFTITFYAKELNVGKEVVTQIDPKAIAFAREAQSYFLSKGVQYTNISVKDEDIPLNYPIRQNPFSD